MSKVVGAFSSSLKSYRSDKWIGVLSSIPIGIGIVIFIFLWSFLYGEVLGWGQTQIKEYVSNQTFGQVLEYTMIAIFTVAFYFLIAYLFVLVVSLICAPFNDVISARVERVCLGKKPLPIGDSFDGFFKQLVQTFVTEFKKIILIITLSIMALLLNLFPLLAPVSLALSGLLLGISFLEYSWSRHNLSFGDIKSDIFSFLLNYTISGCLFLFLVTIPVVNLFVLSFGVNYFTCLFVSHNRDKIEQKEQNTNHAEPLESSRAQENLVTESEASTPNPAD